MPAAPALGVIIIIIISTIFIQDSFFSKDITAITKGPVKRSAEETILNGAAESLKPW